MERTEPNPTFGQRIGLAMKVLFDAALAGRVKALIREDPAVAGPSAERTHASALAVLGAFQREGRLIDFLQQDVAGFGDDEVGAAARVVHSGCKKVLNQYLQIEPAMADAEGSVVSVPRGFDAQRVRLTGNVAGQPPFRGTLKHQGWVAKEVRIPPLNEGLDGRILAPAEVELP